MEEIKTTTIQKFIDMDRRIKDLYQEQSDLIKEHIKEHPEEKQLFQQNSDGTWTRLSLIDNKDEIDAGYWKNVRVERYSVKIENLKNKPKELA